MVKEVREILRRAEAAGWRVEEGTKKWKCKSPDGRFIVIVSKTPSVQNAINRIRHDFQKAGLDLGDKKS